MSVARQSIPKIVVDFLRSAGKRQNVALSETPSEDLPALIIRMVSKLLDVDFEDLPPFYQSADPDGLEAIMGARAPDGYEFDGEVSFTFAGCDVVVCSDVVKVYEQV